MTDEIHSCSYYCDRPACIKAQRDELVRKYVEEQAEWPSDEDVRKVLAVFENTLSDDHSSLRAALRSVRPPVWVVSIPDGYALVPKEAGDSDAFMVYNAYMQPCRTRKDAYKIAIAELASRHAPTKE